jgi:hypothetical protein
MKLKIIKKKKKKKQGIVSSRGFSINAFDLLGGQKRKRKQVINSIIKEIEAEKNLEHACDLVCGPRASISKLVQNSNK